MVTAHIRTQDYWQWAPEMDIVANDHYLDNRLDHPDSELSFAADVTRGLANGAPWMLMETSTSAVSWQPRNVAKAPGELLRNIAAHVARGADAVCFFQWRASRQGAEKFHSALLPHSGTDSKIWRETLAVGRMLSALQPVSGSRVKASVALIFSWQSWWAAEGPSQPSADVRYLDQVHRAYEALRSTGVTVDIVPAGGRFDGYDVVVVPCLYLLTDDQAAAVTDYVSGGGTAIVTFFSGVVDEDDRIRVDPTGTVHPGAFSELLGAWTEEYFPLLPGQQVILSTGATGSLWSEVARPTTASVLSAFIDGPVAGHPAVLSNRYGTGRAVYIATALDATSFAELMGELLADALVAMPAVPVGVERIMRVGDDARFTFVINHTVADVTIDGVGCELITGSAVDGRMVVPAGSVRVLSERLA
jgi:beta-galactosidase